MYEEDASELKTTSFYPETESELLITLEEELKRTSFYSRISNKESTLH